ncbi:MAG TPA: glycoside hydrolase family 15 protein, partial [Armatimonadota bacterium]
LATQVVSCDALALVRFGLRAPDDPRILNTLKVVDALLKVETPIGPAWHRYNDDGYGEHEDGSAFDGTGIGRLWPLLVGERAHYELSADHIAEAERLRTTMEAFANDGGMIPEQIWDSPDNPEHELYFGRPSGSAMPLVWAHAEYVKLCRSLRQGQVFDMLPQSTRRYLVEHTDSSFDLWRFNHQTRLMPVGKILRIEVQAPAVVHWSGDGWHSVQDHETRDIGLGIHYVDLPTAQLPSGRHIDFTFYWPRAGHWEGTNFTMRVSAAYAPLLQETRELLNAA